MHNNSGINKAILLGQINSEPRWQKKGHLDKQLHFTLVTEEQIAKSANPHFEYHQIQLNESEFVKLSENLEKGQWVHVTGKVQTISILDDRRVKRYHTFILAQQVQLMRFPSHERIKNDL
jgi:single-stranded DNA-binding protein